MSGHISTAGHDPLPAGWNSTASAVPSAVGTITSVSTTSTAANAQPGSPATAATDDIVSITERRVKDVSTIKLWLLSLSHIEGLHGCRRNAHGLRLVVTDAKEKRRCGRSLLR